MPTTGSTLDAHPLPGVSAPLEPALLARVAQHELAAALALQLDGLALVRAALVRSGQPCAEVDLVRALSSDMLDVVGLLGALAEPGAAARTGPLAEVVHRLHASYSAMEVSLSRPAARVHVDHARLPTVLANVAGNARAHSAGGLRLVGRVRRGRLCIDLDHDGPSPRCADGFLHADEPPAGRRGLGLWLVRRLVLQMGGSVRLLDRPREPSWTLRVVVPAMPA